MTSSKGLSHIMRKNIKNYKNNLNNLINPILFLQYYFITGNIIRCSFIWTASIAHRLLHTPTRNSLGRLRKSSDRMSWTLRYLTVKIKQTMKFLQRLKNPKHILRCLCGDSLICGINKQLHHRRRRCHWRDEEHLFSRISVRLQLLEIARRVIKWMRWM